MLDRVTVTVDETQLAHLDALVDQLRAAGMQVDQVLRPIGVITGLVTRAQRTVIAAIPGVAAVEDDISHQLPPPDADVQ
jgi:hypothetical protein